MKGNKFKFADEGATVTVPEVHKKLRAVKRPVGKLADMKSPSGKFKPWRLVFNFEMEDEDNPVVIPTDQKGAKYLYLPNPRELGTNVLHLQVMAGLFHAFGEPWTMSHRHTDVTNWGYFIGNDEIERKMLSQVVDAVASFVADLKAPLRADRSGQS